MPRSRIYSTMFATITTIQEPENFWGKLKYNLLPPPVKAEKVEVEGCSGFLKLTVPIVRGKIHWEPVRRAAGDACGSLITQSTFRLHEQAALQRFESDKFMRLLCINSFLKLLSLLPQRKLLQECAVIDMPAALPAALRALPRYCRTIKIITANEQKYTPFVRHCLEEYGTVVCLSEHISKAFDAPVVLHPQPAAIPTAFSRGSLVFASTAKNLYTSRLLTPEGANIPAKYLSLVPKGIAPLPFAAALYEVSGLSELSDCISPAFRMQNSILSYADVISMLDY